LGFRLNGVSESDGPVLNDRGEVFATWFETERAGGSARTLMKPPDGIAWMWKL
jgi:hypothetical protein